MTLNWLGGIFFQVITSISKVYPKDTEAPPGGVDDMTKLSYLHEPGVLENLATRYQLNEIYVRPHLHKSCWLFVQWNYFQAENNVSVTSSDVHWKHTHRS